MNGLYANYIFLCCCKIPEQNVHFWEGSAMSAQQVKKLNIVLTYPLKSVNNPTPDKYRG